MAEFSGMCDAAINLKDRWGDTPLHLACRDGRQAIVEALLKLGANINSTDIGGETPLHVASGKGYQSVVDTLLRFRPDTRSKDSDGRTPLHRACLDGHREVVKSLLKSRSDINSKDNDGRTPLHCACASGHQEIVESLLKCRPDINPRSDTGKTPLHSACFGGHPGVVKSLLKFCPDVNLKDEKGNTPLHVACFWEEVDAVEILLDHGSDINIENERCELPIDRVFGQGMSKVFVWEAIEEVFKVRIVHMKIANVYICRQNLLVLAVGLRAMFKCPQSSFESEIKSAEAQFSEEIARIKCDKIEGTVISLYDILKKDINSLALLMRNEHVVGALRSTDLDLKYPMCARVVRNNFKKGLQRKELLDGMLAVSHLLFNNFHSVLPSNCIDIILSHISNDDLEMLTDICKVGVTQ